MINRFLTDIIVAIAIPALIIGVFLYWKGKETTDEYLTVVVPSYTVDDTSAGGRVKQALQSLRTISFDTGLFTDPKFLSLEEQTVSLPTATVGRANPFIKPSAR